MNDRHDAWQAGYGKMEVRTVKVECLVCDGSGMVPARGQRKDSQKRVPCAVCRGTGQVER